MDGLKKWRKANRISSATQCTRVTTCYPMCNDPFYCICKLVYNLILDGKHMATTDLFPISRKQEFNPGRDVKTSG